MLRHKRRRSVASGEARTRQLRRNRASSIEVARPELVERRHDQFSRRKLRIAMFTYSTQPRGGVLHTLALSEALHDLGHDVVLHAIDDGSGFIREPRCPHVLVPVDAVRDGILPFVRRRIDAYVEAWDHAAPAFDVYHAHDGISGNALATLAERGSISHYIRTVHHLDDFGTSELARLQDRSILLASRWLVVSRLWRERVARAYGCDATVVPNGVDTIRFAPVSTTERARLRAELHLGAGPFFVTIGGIEARKNSLVTLEAFARLRCSLPGARLIIAGGASIFAHGEYRRAFDARMAELDFSDGSVVLAGVLPDDQIVRLLRAADALVFPSLIEGFGLVVLEALACGTPVVTSAIAPFTEFLTGREAVLVDPRDPSAIADAMLRALDPRLAATLAERGPELARRFSWAASARAHERAYAALDAPRAEAARA